MQCLGSIFLALLCALWPCFFKKNIPCVPVQLEDEFPSEFRCFLYRHCCTSTPAGAPVHFLWQVHILLFSFEGCRLIVRECLRVLHFESLWTCMPAMGLYVRRNSELDGGGVRTTGLVMRGRRMPVGSSYASAGAWPLGELAQVVKPKETASFWFLGLAVRGVNWGDIKDGSKSFYNFCLIWTSSG